jgi:type 1 glutamine amidotransferase
MLLITFLCVTLVIAWSNGWSSHAERINAMATKKKDRTEKTIESVEKKAVTAADEGKVVYRTITREVVKYVQSPNHTVCKFDDDAVQLRQHAIEAANSIPGFDGGAVQSK